MPTLGRYLAAGRDVARDAVSWRPGRQTSEDTYLAARTLHRKTAGASSRAALALVRALHERGGSGAPTALDPRWRPVLADVNRDGVGYTPSLLDDDALARIRDFTSTAPAILSSVDGGMRRGTLQDRDEGTAGVRIVEQFVLDQPDIQGVIASPEVRAFARAYFKATPVIHPPQVYWSLAGARVTEQAALASARRFHWDYDGLAGLRLHMYLTDVDEGAAPMQYVAGSHRQGGLRSPALRSADMGVADDELYAQYPHSAVRTLTGPAGTTFISDSRGLHRGNDALTKDRLFLVMPMQATGFGGYQLRPRTVTPVDPGLHECMEQGLVELSLFRPRREGAAGTR